MGASSSDAGFREYALRRSAAIEEFAPITRRGELLARFARGEPRIELGLGSQPPDDFYFLLTYPSEKKV
jgi:hypothetical protein